VAVGKKFLTLPNKKSAAAPAFKVNPERLAFNLAVVAHIHFGATANR
jgi:hypothetical protein